MAICIIDEWHDSKDDVTYTADKYLDDKVKLKVEYYERYGGAAIKVWWEKISGPRQTTPTTDADQHADRLARHRPRL